MKILGIESSCDETAAAVIEDGRKICSSVIHTQVEEHKLYGGVVPEIASRRHIESICGVTAEALEQAGLTAREVDAVAVTAAPGLIGAVLVGVNFAKGLALSAEKPLIPVHHIRGHVAANYLAHPELEPPFLALIVSGGHSHIVLVRDYCDYTILGRTTDDAAGEAFDKAARCVGLPYPGGVALDAISHEGDPHAYPLPIPHAEGEFNFSFSGLKTAVINLAHNAEQKGEELDRASLAASFTAAVSDALVPRTMMAAKELGYKKIAIAGGVAANSRIRADFKAAAEKNGCELFVPPLKLCGDNAAMIGAAGYYAYKLSRIANLDLNSKANDELR